MQHVDSASDQGALDSLDGDDEFVDEGPSFAFGSSSTADAAPPPAAPVPFTEMFHFHRCAGVCTEPLFPMFLPGFLHHLAGMPCVAVCDSHCLCL